MKRKSGLTWQSQKRQQSNPLLIILGLVLTVPAFGMLWASYIQPLQTMITWSTQNVNPIRSSDAQSVGGANFQGVFENPALPQSLTFTLLIIGGRVLAVAIIPPLLGWALSRFGHGLRFFVRLFIALPLVFFAPAITAISWRVALNPVFGLFPNQTALSSPTDAIRTLQLIDFLTSFGIACAFGVYAYVVAFRPLGGEGTRRGTQRGFFAVWLTSLALAVATALQSITFVYALTKGGPVNSTRALPLLFYQIAYQQFRFGSGAALGVLMLAVVMLLGLIVGLYIILSNIGLISLRPMRFRVLGRSVAFLIMAVLFVGALALILLNLIPVLWVYLTPGAGVEQAGSAIPLAQLLINSIVPVLGGTVAQLPGVYLAALGIGALRPLGRYSLALLLPFSPFLFVTTFLLSPALFTTLRAANLINTATSLAVAGAVLNIGALFLLTLFFKGQTALWDREEYPGFGGFFRVVILPSFPLVLLITALAVDIGAQDVNWSLIVAQQPGNFPVGTYLLQFSGQLTARSDSVNPLVQQIGLVFNAIYGAMLLIFGVLFVDRLALGTPASLRDALAQADPPIIELQ